MKMWILHHVEILNLSQLFVGGKEKVSIQNFPHNKSFITLWRDTSGCHHIKVMLRTGFRHPPLHRQTTATAGPYSQTPLTGRCHIQSPGWDTQATPTHTLVHTISRWWDALTHTHTHGLLGSRCPASVHLEGRVSRRTACDPPRIYMFSLYEQLQGVYIKLRGSKCCKKIIKITKACGCIAHLSLSNAGQR